MAKAKVFGMSGKEVADLPQGGGEGTEGLKNDLAGVKVQLKSSLGGLDKETLSDFWESEDESISTVKESDAYVDAISSKMMADYLLKKVRDLRDTLDQQEGEAGGEAGKAEGEGKGKGGESGEDSEDKDGEEGEGQGEGDSDEDADEEGGQGGKGQGKDGDEDSEDEHGEGQGKAPPKEGSGEHSEEIADLEKRVGILEVWRKEDADPKLTQLVKDALKEAKEAELPPAPKTPEGEELGWMPDDLLFRMLFEKEPDGGELKELADAGGEIIAPEWLDRAEAVVKSGLPIFMAGPSGCGKSTVPQLIAKHLNVPYGAHSCSEGMHTGDLAGLLLPVEAGGTFVYVPSLFISMCTQPGLFLWDELDAADANFLVGFNMMLAQRELFIATRRLSTLGENEINDLFTYWNAVYGAEKCAQKLGGRDKIRSLSDLRTMLGKDKYEKLDQSFTKVKLHPKFTVVAAANTFGHGADRVYAGRNQLDGATLDRFRIGFFNIDYSEKVERKILSREAFAWGTYMRTALAEMKMSKRLMTTRFLRDCTTMQKSSGWTQSDWAAQYFADWPVDEANRVKDRVKQLIVSDLQKKGM